MATAFRTRREPRVQGRATPRRPAERRAFAHLPRRVSGLPGPGASERAAVNVARGPACGRGWPPPQAGATERECRQSALTLDTAPGGRASSASIVPTPVCGTPPEAGGKRRAAGTPLLSSRASGDGAAPRHTAAAGRTWVRSTRSVAHVTEGPTARCIQCSLI